MSTFIQMWSILKLSSLWRNLSFSAMAKRLNTAADWSPISFMVWMYSVMAVPMLHTVVKLFAFRKKNWSLYWSVTPQLTQCLSLPIKPPASYSDYRIVPNQPCRNMKMHLLAAVYSWQHFRMIQCLLISQSKTVLSICKENGAAQNW